MSILYVNMSTLSQRHYSSENVFINDGAGEIVGTRVSGWSSVAEVVLPSSICTVHVQ